MRRVVGMMPAITVVRDSLSLFCWPRLRARSGAVTVLNADGGLRMRGEVSDAHAVAFALPVSGRDNEQVKFWPTRRSGARYQELIRDDAMKKKIRRLLVGGTLRFAGSVGYIY